MTYRGRDANGEPSGWPNRRQVLRIGSLGVFGLNLARLLEAEAGAARGASTTSAARPLRHCIVIYFYGGPSHLDTWDLKPNAPREVRGEFRPIATAAPGVQICEHLPHCARVMDRLAVVRTLHHTMRNHNSAAVEALCGRTPLPGDGELLADGANNFPCYGSVVSRQLTRPREVPAHVALPHVMYNVVKLPGQSAGFLGAAYNPFQVTRDPNAADFRVEDLDLQAGLSLARIEGRRSLLARMERQAAVGHPSAAQRALNVYQEQAMELMQSERVRRAFDISQENIQLRERYGRNRLGQSLLLARRLVEAGVRFVNVNDKIRNGQLANWDSHQNNFARLKDDLLPPADQSFAALIEDLEQRGLLESTLVVGLAEFGRTPRINQNAGRDHWPDCFSIVLAGGGVQGGAVYGSSDRSAAEPATDPVSPGDLAATLYWRFGIDPAAEMRDLADRPYRLADGRPLQRLFL